MPRRRQRRQRPARPCDDLSLADPPAGRNRASIPSPPPSPAAASRAIARLPSGQHRGADPLGEGARALTVVEMAVGHQHRRDPLARQRRHDGVEVPRIARPGSITATSPSPEDGSASR